MDGREQIKLLQELQHLESELAQLRKRQSQNLQTKERIRQAISTGEKAISEAMEGLESRRKAYREMEADTKYASDQVRKLNAKLNMVKTNKEYHALLKEIDEIKRDISKAEDEMLSRLEKIDAKDAALKEQDALHSRAKEEADQTQAKIEADDTASRARMDNLVGERQILMEQLPQRTCALYERVCKGQTNGVAVSAVIESVCSGCNVNIPPQLFIELQRCDTIRLCPSCQRIIYWPECC